MDMQQSVTASYSRIQELAIELELDERAYEFALRQARLTPAPFDWMRYFSHFMLTLAVMLVIAGVTAFFAWNWAELDHLVKFALIQVVIAVLVILAWRFEIDSPAGRASLFAAAFLVGVLLAVFGQVYQTGADPYGLFLAWGLLILPWAAIGRQAALWILVQVLANVTLIMFWTQIVEPPEGWWQLAQLLGPLVWLSSTLMNSTLASLVFALNLLGLLIWEIAAARHVPWVRGRTYPRIIAFLAFCSVLVPTVVLVIGGSIGVGGNLGYLSPLLYGCATAAGYYYYRYRQHDLAMLTLCLFGVLLVTTTLFVRYLAQTSGGILMLALLLIGQVAAAAYWLRDISVRWERES